MKIKSVSIINNLIEYNVHHERDYFLKKGIMKIVLENDEQFILELQSQSDISGCDYLKLYKTKISKEKYLFKNSLYFDE